VRHDTNWGKDDGSYETIPEYGVVVHCWLDPDIDFHECHIAFYGDELPTGAHKKPPYILRYSSNSLTVLAD
jgi:hypothetical protein